MTTKPVVYLYQSHQTADLPEGTWVALSDSGYILGTAGHEHPHTLQPDHIPGRYLEVCGTLDIDIHTVEPADIPPAVVLKFRRNNP